MRRIRKKPWGAALLAYNHIHLTTFPRCKNASRRLKSSSSHHFSTLTHTNAKLTLELMQSRQKNNNRPTLSLKMLGNPANTKKATAATHKLPTQSTDGPRQYGNPNANRGPRFLSHKKPYADATTNNVQQPCNSITTHC